MSRRNASAVKLGDAPPCGLATTQYLYEGFAPAAHQCTSGTRRRAAHHQQMPRKPSLRSGAGQAG